MRTTLPWTAARAAVLVATTVCAACALPRSAALPVHRAMQPSFAMAAHAHAGPSAASRAFPRLWDSREARRDARAGAHVVVVKMITTDDGDGGKFDPESIVAAAGDTVRFVTDGLSPHNVSFPAAQNAAPLHPPAPVPFLTAAGQSYDLVLPPAPGTYHIQCDPHAFTGMTGTLTIRE
ncbi:MAG: Plastocyanin [Gemmatimonadetes bacterium]|nr:Plastocyanin [Gemmatimonadota bacterium]